MSNIECEKEIEVNKFNSSKNVFLAILHLLPNGLSKDIACVDFPFQVGKSCAGESGSPAIVKVSNTARDDYFEQKFVLATSFKCQLSKMVLVRVASRQILNWIQKITGK